MPPTNQNKKGSTGRLGFLPLLPAQATLFMGSLVWLHLTAGSLGSHRLCVFISKQIIAYQTLILLQCAEYSHLARKILCWKHPKTALIRNSQETDTFIIVSTYPCRGSLRSCLWLTLWWWLYCFISCHSKYRDPLICFNTQSPVQRWNSEWSFSSNPGILIF